MKVIRMHFITTKLSINILINRYHYQRIRLLRLLLPDICEVWSAPCSILLIYIIAANGVRNSSMYWCLSRNKSLLTNCKFKLYYDILEVKYASHLSSLSFSGAYHYMKKYTLILLTFCVLINQRDI